MSDKPRHNGGADDSDGDFDLSGFAPGASDSPAAKPAKAPKPPSADAPTPTGPKIKGNFPKTGPRRAPGAGYSREGGPDAKGPEAKGPRTGARGFRPSDVPPSRGAGVPRGPRAN